MHVENLRGKCEFCPPNRPFLRENRTRRTRALARTAPEFPDFLDWASHIVARVSVWLSGSAVRLRKARALVLRRIAVLYACVQRSREPERNQRRPDIWPRTPRKSKELPFLQPRAPVPTLRRISTASGSSNAVRRNPEQNVGGVKMRINPGRLPSGVQT